MEIVNGNPVNETHANVKRSRSTFNLHQMILDTHRFGEIHPHLVIDGVTSDKLPFRSSHSARSYTLKAPLMQDIKMSKDYFMVPLRAILPFQADRIITNPTIGDDVPSDAYTHVEDLNTKISSIVSSIDDYVFDSLDPTDAADNVLINTWFLKKLVLFESVYSDGSLLASLGCNLNPCLVFQPDGDRLSIDQFLDKVISFVATCLASSDDPKQNQVQIDGQFYYLLASKTSHDSLGSLPVIELHEFLSRIRDTSDWSFESLDNPDSENFLMDLYDEFNSDYPFSIVTSTRDVDIDLARLWAYHLCAAEFYTNDKVDYIYSAELFRQYIYSLWQSASSPSSEIPPSFSWNGQSLPYDYLSAKFFKTFVNYFSIEDGSDIPVLQYFLTLFGYHRSLRYKDYFTGSRTRPLAVGDTSIPVVGGNVSVIDVSRNIQMQRFLNAVNATGRKFGEYLKGIFGVAPSPDRHNPIFLAHTQDSIFTAEVENTGDAQQTEQNSVTAIFRGNSNKFAFEVDVDEPCIILGVTIYDIERAYTRGIERSFFTKDRYDMFLPQLQYVGDQPVYTKELISNAVSGNFGYQFRDMDRKQLVNRAVGGFAADVLPGYAFVYRNSRIFTLPVISPDFIRSIPSELDEFYLSLTGYSLATYFHFIVLNNNMCPASRPMSYNPQILG